MKEFVQELSSALLVFNDQTNEESSLQTIRDLTTSPYLMPALVEIINNREGQKVDVRRLAIHLLMKHTRVRMGTMSTSDDNDFKYWILHWLATEPDASLRRLLVGMTVQYCNSNETFWTNQLWKFVDGATTAHTGDDSSRHLAFSIVSQLDEWIITQLPKDGYDDEEMAQLHLEKVRDFFRRGLTATATTAKGTVSAPTGATTTPPPTRLLVLKAMQKNLAHLSSEDLQFLSLTPDLLEIGRSLVEASATNNSREISWVIKAIKAALRYDYSQVVPMEEKPTIDGYVEQMFDFLLCCLQQAAPKERDEAKDVLALKGNSEDGPPHLLRNEDLLPKLMQKLLLAVAKNPIRIGFHCMDGPNEWKRDEDLKPSIEADKTPSSMANNVVFQLALGLQNEQALKLSIAVFLPWLQKEDSHSLDAALFCIGSLIRGCADMLGGSLGYFIPLNEIVEAALKSKSDAAVACLSQLCTSLSDQMLPYSEEILAVARTSLDSPNEWVQVAAGKTILHLCTCMEASQLQPHVDTLMERLVVWIGKTEIGHVKEMLIAAILGVAAGMGKSFCDRVEGVAGLLTPMLQSEQTSSRTKCRALDCLSYLARCDKDAFRPFLGVTLQHLTASLESEDLTLRRYGFCCMDNLVQGMGSDISSVVSMSMSKVLAACSEMEEDIEELQPADSIEELSSPFRNLYVGDDDDEFPPGREEAVFKRPEALIETNVAGMNVLGSIARHGGPEFEPYVDEALRALLNKSSHPEPTVKETIAELLPSLIKYCVREYEGGHVARVKDGENVHLIKEKTASTVYAVWTNLSMLMRDVNQSVVYRSCESGREVMEAVGPAGTRNGNFEVYLDNLIKLLQKQAPCSHYGDSVMATNAYVLIAMEFVVDLGKMLGSSIRSRHLSRIMKALQNLSQDHNPMDERLQSLAIMSHLVPAMGDAGFAYWKDIFSPAAMAAIEQECSRYQKSDVRLQRNGVCVLGVCCEQYGESLADEYLAFLGRVMPLLDMKIPEDDPEEGVGACVDNAAACLCRMIAAVPKQVPLDTTIPKLLRVLPLKRDFSECETVYGVILKLLEEEQPEIMSRTLEVKSIFDAATVDNEMEDGLKSRLKQASERLRKRKRT